MIEHFAQGSCHTRSTRLFPSVDDIKRITLGTEETKDVPVYSIKALI